MNWTKSVTRDELQDIFNGIAQLESEHMLAIINDVYMQIGIEPIPESVARHVSRRTRQNLIWDLMIETDQCDDDTLSYWIDRGGKYKIVIFFGLRGLKIEAGSDEMYPPLMGEYMVVVLDKAYQNDAFIKKLNVVLNRCFGANNDTMFNPWYFLQDRVEYYNITSRGEKRLKSTGRAMTMEELGDKFYAFRHGEFHFKISGNGFTSFEAKDAVAICKFIAVTKEKFIDKKLSKNFNPTIIKKYVNSVLEKDGYDLDAIWKTPDGHANLFS